MPRNTIIDLQNHLFAQLENLSDARGKELETEIKRAKAIQTVASVIVNSAKTQIDFARAMKGERDVRIPIMEKKLLAQ